MIIVVVWLRVFFFEVMIVNDGKVFEVMKFLCFLLVKFVWRICIFFFCKLKGVDEELVKGMIESCESCEISFVFMFSVRLENILNFDIF